MQYLINGAIFPIFALYMKNYLHFTGAQTGIILAMSSVTALVSPLLGAVVADKYLPAERLFGICHFTAAGLIFLLALQKTFLPVLILYFLFALFYGPTAALANAIVFHHAPEGREKFGGMRLWGTVGWVSVAFGFSFFWLGRGGVLRDALILAGLAGTLQGIFAFSALPKGEKRAAGRVTLFPTDAFKVFLRRDILILSVVSLFFVTGEKIYYFGAGLYLRSLGLAETYVMPFMSIAQIAEVAAMVLLAPLLMRWRTKWVLVLGLFFSVFKFSFLAAGAPLVLVGTGVALHGPAFTFFMITCFIYLDRHCRKEFRTGVHQIFNFLEAGFANFMGNVGAGFLLDSFIGPQGGVNFARYWLIPGIIAVVLLLTILFLFPSREPPAEEDVPAVPEPGLEPMEGV